MSDHLITTPPTLTICGTCSAPLLAAVVTGLERHIDPTPLTPVGELQALMARIPTFELRGSVLMRRTVEHITAGARGCVLAEHTHRPIPDQFIDRSHMAVAMRLVARLLGTPPVVAELHHTPPPF